MPAVNHVAISRNSDRRRARGTLFGIAPTSFSKTARRRRLCHRLPLLSPIPHPRTSRFRPAFRFNRLTADCRSRRVSSFVSACCAS